VVADQVFHVTLGSGQHVLLHLEFQGRRSHQAMSWRMLDYMARLAATHRLAMHSVVIYIGRGAGANDSGMHHVEGAFGLPALSWRYGVVRLWQLSARELLALGSPALLALVGQTRIEQPEVVLPEVLSRLRRVPEPERRSRLFTALLALIEDEEITEMVERLLESDELLMDTPFLRRIREEGRQESRRQDILQALTLRFGPQDDRLVGVLEQISDGPRLEALFAAAIQSADLDAFRAVLDSGERSE
jgi:predicted transposase YdaD